MKRIYVTLTLLLCLTLVLSACILPTAPTQEEAERAEELLESVDETTSADLDPSTAADEATDGVIGQETLDQDGIGESAFAGRELGIDFSDSCTEIYPDTTLTIFQPTSIAGPFATIFNEHFFTGVADAVVMVNENVGPCGVELAPQAVAVEYDPAQLPDLPALGMDETLPLFLLTYNHETTLNLNEQMQSSDPGALLRDPEDIVLDLGAEVLYIPSAGEMESILSSEISGTQLLFAEQAFEEAGYGEGGFSYMAGYGSVLVMAEIIKEVLNRSGIEGLGDAVFFTVVDQRMLQR